MEFDPIILRYEGLAADDHMIELSQIGQSLQGAAQLIGTAASIAATGEYVKQTTAMPVRVYAGVPRNGSWEIPAIILATAPILMNEFPIIKEMGKIAATNAATSIVNYAVEKWRPKPASDIVTEHLALEIVQKAMAEVGQTSRHAIDAVTRMAEQQRPAMRALVVPIGLSCETLRIGDPAGGAVAIDRELRAAIEAPEDREIHSAASHEILISKMDRVNCTCKFAFRDDQDGDRRITGEITDPIIQSANDPYSAAFSAQRWVKVTGKLQTKKSEPDRLYISDILV